MKRICVFCGSNAGNNTAYGEKAVALGKLLAEKDIELVYGGGQIGLMGLIAESVLESGGSVIGIIPESLARKEIAHANLTNLIVVETMHKRKAMMEELSDGFIALPGGFGTFEELCEMITWAQLGFHRKPCGLINIEGYYDPLVEMFNRSEKDGFVRPEHLNLVLIETGLEDMLQKMANYVPPSIPKWIDGGDL